MISRVTALTKPISWAFVYLLYRGTLPAYILLDNLAAHLDNLWLSLLLWEIESGCPKERSAAARGLSQENIDRYLQDAREITTREFVESIFAATAILFAVAGFSILAFLNLARTYHWF